MLNNRKVRVGQLLAMTLVPLAGCTTIPSSGPTSTEILRNREDAALLGFRVVNIDSPAAVDAASAPPAGVRRIASLAAEGSVDTVGPGDILGINIFEVGTSLFASPQTNLSDNAGVSIAPPRATNTAVSGVVVDREGTISLPYVGRLRVAGLRPIEIQDRIQRALRGLSQNPQVLVGVRGNLSNTVFVQGVVAKPGRQDLSLARNRLLDAVADAGGTGDVAQEDVVVRLSRGGQSVEQLLSTIAAGSPDDVILLPGDRIQVIRRPQSYTVFGATKVAQVNFSNPSLSLAEALARAGGPIDERADPTAIFVFRYARDANGLPVVPDPAAQATGVPAPTIYRIDLMRPASYFLAQRFAMQDKDVVYFANAKSNRPAKLINIINQLFSPLLTARVLTQNN